MNTRHRTLRLALMLALAALVLPGAAFGSGTYCLCIPKPPTQKAQVDREKYDLGQKVFNGRVLLAETATGAEDQAPRLRALQAQLPKRTAKKTDLTALAGKLSKEQLDALEYYVQHRYGNILTGTSK